MYEPRISDLARVIPSIFELPLDERLHYHCCYESNLDISVTHLYLFNSSYTQGYINNSLLFLRVVATRPDCPS